tara:strand:- start:230 stop:487 length:258 start_codon:yes stop_codon:yes gene_type:complete
MKELKLSKYTNPKDSTSFTVDLPDNFYTTTTLGNIVYMPNTTANVDTQLTSIQNQVQELDDRLARIELALTHVIPHILDKLTTDK